MLLAVTSPPAAEPVTLAEVKKHLRVLHSSEDTEIERYAKAARQHIEGVLGRALITQTLKHWLPVFPAGGVIDLPKPPLQSVTAVRYRDEAGTVQTLSASAYHVLTESVTAWLERAASATWPRLATHPKAVEIEYIAGYGEDPGDVPEDIRSAILLLTEHLYFNRGATVEGNLSVNPIAVDSLLAKHMTHGWI